jgi:undecaprenyl-diphosphatase
VTQPANPVDAQVSQAGWRRWALFFWHHGKQRLAALGVVLVGGFLLALGALVFFADIADDILEKEAFEADSLATHVLDPFRSPVADWAMRATSAMGSEVVLILFVLLLAGWGWQRRWGACVAIVLVTLGSQMLNNVLKELFQRTRPSPVESFISAQSWSFPSGHAMVSAAFYLFVAYMAWRALRGRWRWLAVVDLMLLVGAIGVSRVYLQAHYLSDVLAGYAAGFIWVFAVLAANHLLDARAARRQAVRETASAPA